MTLCHWVTSCHCTEEGSSYLTADVLSTLFLPFGTPFTWSSAKIYMIFCGQFCLLLTWVAHFHQWKSHALNIYLSRCDRKSNFNTCQIWKQGGTTSSKSPMGFWKSHGIWISIICMLIYCHWDQKCYLQNYENDVWSLLQNVAYKYEFYFLLNWAWNHSILISYIASSDLDAF